ncbi:MAG: Rieske 2Fe-2S domain-containing protein [Rhizobiaceae bacterium]
MSASARLFALPDLGDLAPGEVRRIDDTPLGPVALVNVDGELHATSDLCPHARAPLSEGFVEGHWLVCPTHFAEFDVRSGEARNAPPRCRPLVIHRLVRDGDRYCLEIPDK